MSRDLSGTNAKYGTYFGLKRWVRDPTSMSQWVKLAEEQGEIVRKLKEEIKADPSRPKDELDAAVAKLKELKAKADDPMNALEDPVTKVRQDITRRTH